MSLSIIAELRRRSRALKADTYALYLACRDPRVGWPARLLTVAVVAYAFSPIDLIPDFIPVIGYLDDLILLPLGIALALQLIPTEVMAESRARAAALLDSQRPTNWVAAALIIAVWILVLAATAILIWRAVNS